METSWKQIKFDMNADLCRCYDKIVQENLDGTFFLATSKLLSVTWYAMNELKEFARG